MTTTTEIAKITTTHGGKWPSIARRRRNCVTSTNVKITAAAVLDTDHVTLSERCRRFKSAGTKPRAVTTNPPSM
jgi:hypothetical protein